LKRSLTYDNVIIIRKGLIIIIHKIDEIEIAAIAEISKRVNEFGNKIRKGTANPEGFMSMNDIENNWLQLKNATDKVYADMVSQMITSIDERDIVCKKKESTENVE